MARLRHTNLLALGVVFTLPTCASAPPRALTPPGGSDGAPPKSGAWAPAAKLPEVISEASGASDGANLYVNTFTGNTYRFDGQTWTKIASNAEKVDHSGLAVVNGKLYAFGGLSAWGGKFPSSAKTWVLDLSNAAAGWVDTHLDLPSPRGAFATTLSGTRVYLAGGIGGGSAQSDARDLSEVISADLGSANPAWTSFPPLSAARDHLTAQVMNGKLYVIGGRSAGAPLPLDPQQFSVNATVDVYDLTANKKLANAADLPNPRGGLASGVLNGRIIVLGGEGAVSGATNGNVFDLTQAYDPATGAWASLPNMITARHGIAAGVVNGVLEAAGGGTQMAKSSTDVVEGYSEP